MNVNGTIIRKDYKKVFGAYFFLSDNKSVFNRHAENILEVLSALGGLSKLILVFILAAS